MSLRHSSDFYAADVLTEFLGRLSVFLTELLDYHILDELRFRFGRHIFAFLAGVGG